MSFGLNFRAWEYDPRTADAAGDFFWFIDFETSAIPSPQALGYQKRLTPLSVTAMPYKWSSGGQLVPAPEAGEAFSANIIPSGVPRNKRAGFLTNVLGRRLRSGDTLGEMLGLTPDDFVGGRKRKDGVEVLTEATVASRLNALFTQTPGRVILGGHKVHEFDQPVLDAMLERHNYPTTQSRGTLVADTLRIARQLPQITSNKLESIMSYFGLDVEGYHKSHVDVPASASIYGKLLSLGQVNIPGITQPTTAIPTGRMPMAEPRQPNPAELSYQSARVQQGPRLRGLSDILHGSLPEHLGDAETLFGPYMFQNKIYQTVFAGSEFSVQTENLEGGVTRLNVLRQMGRGNEVGLTLDLRLGPQTIYGPSIQIMTGGGAGYYVGGAVKGWLNPKGEGFSEQDSIYWSSYSPERNLASIILGAFYKAERAPRRGQEYTPQHGLTDVIQSGLSTAGTSDQWLIQKGLLMGMPNERETTLRRFAQQMPLYLQSTRLGEDLTYSAQTRMRSAFWQQLQSQRMSTNLNDPTERIFSSLRSGAYFINEEGRLQSSADTVDIQYGKDAYGRNAITAVSPFMMRDPRKYIGKESVYGWRTPAQPIVSYDAGREDLLKVGEPGYITRGDRAPLYARLNALYPGEANAVNEFIGTVLYANTPIAGGGLQYGNRFRDIYSFGQVQTKTHRLSAEQMSLTQLMDPQMSDISFKLNMGREIEGGVSRVSAGRLSVWNRPRTEEGAIETPSNLEIGIGESGFVPLEASIQIPRYARITNTGQWMPVPIRPADLPDEEAAQIIEMKQFEAQLSKRFGVPVHATGIEEIAWQIKGAQTTGTKVGGLGIKFGVTPTGASFQGVDFMTGELKQPVMAFWGAFAAMSPTQQLGDPRTGKMGIIEEWARSVAKQPYQADIFMESVRKQYGWDARTARGEPPVINPTFLERIARSTDLIEDRPLTGGWSVIQSMFDTLYGTAPRNEAEWQTQERRLKMFGVGWRKARNVSMGDWSKSSLAYFQQTFEDEFNARKLELGLTDTWEEKFNEIYQVGRAGAGGLRSLTRREVVGLQMRQAIPFEIEYAGGMKLNYEAIFALQSRYPALASKYANPETGYTDAVSQAWASIYRASSFESGGARPAPLSYRTISGNALENIQAKMIGLPDEMSNIDKVKNLEAFIEAETAGQKGSMDLLFFEGTQTYLPGPRSALELEYTEHQQILGHSTTMWLGAFSGVSMAQFGAEVMNIPGLSMDEQLLFMKEQAQQATSNYYGYYNRVFAAGEEAAKRVWDQRNIGIAGMGGRYAALPGLEANEAYIPHSELNRLLKSAGVPRGEFGEARELLHERGFVPGVMWRYPQLSNAGGYMGMKIMTEEHLLARGIPSSKIPKGPRRIGRRFLRGNPFTNDVMFVSPLFAEAMAGDFDYDPYAMLGLMRYSGDKGFEIFDDPTLTKEIQGNVLGILKDTRAYLAKMFPSERIRGQTSALRATVGDLLGEMGDPNYIIRASEQFGYKEEHFRRLMDAAENYAANKMGMGITYNIRRRLEAAGVILGVSDEALQENFEASAQLYQPHLDLYNALGSGMETATRAMFKVQTRTYNGMERKDLYIQWPSRIPGEKWPKYFPTKLGANALFKGLASEILRPEVLEKLGSEDIDITANSLFSYAFHRDAKEMKRLNKLLEGAKGSDRAEIYMKYLDAEGSQGRFSDPASLYRTPIGMALLSNALAKKYGHDDEAFIRETLIKNLGQETTDMIEATQTLFGMSAARGGTVPAGRFEKVLEIIEGQLAPSLGGAIAHGMIERAFGGRLMAQPGTPGGPGGPRDPNTPVAPIFGDWNEDDIKNIGDILGRALAPHLSPDFKARPPSLAEAFLTSTLAPSLLSFTQDVTTTWQALPGMLKQAYPDYMGRRRLSPQAAWTKFMTGTMEGKIDPEVLLQEQPELLQILRALPKNVSRARDMQFSEVQAFIVGSAREQQAMNAAFRSMAWGSGDEGDTLTQATAGFLSMIKESGGMSTINRALKSMGVPELTQPEIDTYEQRMRYSAEMAAAQAITMFPDASTPYEINRATRISARGKAGVALSTQQIKMQRMQAQMAKDFPKAFATPADVPNDPMVARAMIESAGRGRKTVKDVNTAIDRYATQVDRVSDAETKMQAAEAELSPLPASAKAAVEATSASFDKMTEKALKLADVMNDATSSVADVTKATEELNTAAAEHRLAERRVSAGRRLGMAPSTSGGLDSRDLISRLEGAKGRLLGRADFGETEREEVAAINREIEGLRADERTAAQARYEQRVGTSSRSFLSQMGGAARRLFGGFGLMYMRSVIGMAGGASAYGYEQSMALQEGATAAVGSAVGGIPMRNPAVDYSRAQALYGGFGRRYSQGVMADLAVNQPAMFEAAQTVWSGAVAGGAGLFLGSTLGLSNPATAVVAGTLAIGSALYNTYTNYQGAMADPLQNAVAIVGQGRTAELNANLTNMTTFERLGYAVGGWGKAAADYTRGGFTTTGMAYVASPDAQKYAKAIEALDAAEASAVKELRRSGGRAGAGTRPAPFNPEQVLRSEGFESQAEINMIQAAWAQVKAARAVGVSDKGAMAAVALESRYSLALAPEQFVQFASMLDQGVPVMEAATGMITASGGGITQMEAAFPTMIPEMLGVSTGDLQKMAAGAEFAASLGPWAEVPLPDVDSMIARYGEGFGKLRPRGQAMMRAEQAVMDVYNNWGVGVGAISPFMFRGEWSDERYEQGMLDVEAKQRRARYIGTIREQMLAANMTPEAVQAYIEPMVSDLSGLYSEPDLQRIAQEKMAANTFLQGLVSNFGITPGRANYLGPMLQSRAGEFSLQEWSTMAGASQMNQGAMAQLWGMQYSGQIPTNIGLNMLEAGYLMSTDINQFGPMRGIPSTQPLFSRSMNWGAMNAEGMAVQLWGADWESGGPTLPAAPGAQHTSMRQAMVRGIPLPGATDLAGGQRMLGGRAAANYMLSNLQYESAMASAGLALEGINLQMAFQTGVGLGNYNTVNPQTGQPFNINTGSFRWNVPGVGNFRSTGGGLWGVQDAMRSLSYAQQGYAFDRQAQQLEMQSEFFYQNIGMAQQQASMQRRWAREDWGFQDQQRALTWQWRQEDFAEQSRFMTGRDRRLAERQMQRETIMYGIEGEQIETQRERQQELWALEDQRFDLQKTQHEEQKRFQEESIETNRRFFEERKKLEEEMQKIQRAFQVEQWELAKKSAASQAYYAQKSKEAQDTLVALAEDQADINDLIVAAVAGSDEALTKLAEFWDVSIAEARRAIAAITGVGGGGGGGGGSDPNTTSPKLSSSKVVYQDDDWVYYEDGGRRNKHTGKYYPSTLSAPVSGNSEVTYNPWDDELPSLPSESGNVSPTLAIYIGDEEIKNYIVQTVNEELEVA